MHPHESEIYTEIWKEDQEIEQHRHAEVLYLLALNAGVKIGGRTPKLKDFLPDSIVEKSEKTEISQQQKEENLKKAFKMLAIATKKKHK